MSDFSFCHRALLSSSSFLLPTKIAFQRKKGGWRNNRSKRNEVLSCFSDASYSSSFSPFKCPTCAKPLTKNSTALRCPNEHSRDIAREGFANLLMTKTVTGDTKEMVQSRKLFLDSQKFDFLFEEKLKREVSEAVSRCVEREENADDDESSGIKNSNSEKSEKTHHHPDGNNNGGFKVGPRRKKLEAKKRARAEQALEKNNKRKEDKEDEAEGVVFCTIADIGCGDGYWLEKISRWLVFGENDSDDSDVVSLRERARKRNVRFRFIGIDASKEAVRVAAKRMMITTTANKNERSREEKVNGAEFFFAVADANDVPMEDDSVDISLSVFAPRNGKEIERTMKEKGTLLVVSPSPLHLQELRSNEAKERGVICLNIEDNKSERVEKQLKELTSLSPISRSSSSSSEIIERAVPMSSQDVQLLLKMGASGFHQTDASLNAARTYWNSNAVAKTSSSASAERGGGEVVVHEEAPQRKVTLSFHVRAFSKQKKNRREFQQRDL